MRIAAALLATGMLTTAGLAQEGVPTRVFFDWSKPELSRDAQAELDRVVGEYRRLQPSRVDLAGHSDRSGPKSVNLVASRRRAEAVRAYLVSRGVPATALTIAAFGESQPLVPTEDGVREVQNRRVEIRFAGSVRPGAAPLIDASGTQVGTARLVPGAAGATLVVEIDRLAPGTRAMHLHAVGRCDVPDFASAGPHWNPANRQHGRANPLGPHLGDLPNVTIDSARAQASVALPAGADDADGVALVIHAGPDDDRTDPSGNSGARIACAVLSPGR